VHRTWQRHLNKLRWLILSLVFCALILLPFFHLYQTYLASHSYDLLLSKEKMVYDSMESLTAPFLSDPEKQLEAVKGTTWSGTLFGLKLSDPLAVVSQASAGIKLYWPFILTAAIPVIFTVIFGRFFCGWICPATFVYELNDNLGTWLRKAGLPISQRRMDRRLKYLVLGIGAVLSAATGAVLFAAIYPPAIIGREIYYAVAVGGFGGGTVFFLLTLLFDLMVSRRGFCRYLCPGGALYSLCGRYRVFRIQRDVTNCNDCAKCNVVCQFDLNPLRDGFGQECNNCTACIAVCPTDALRFELKVKDAAKQGPGHLGQLYRKQQQKS
jgi:ferredoxin-type protein NapH